MAIEIDLQSSNFGVPFSGAYFRVVAAAITYQRGGVRSVMIDVAGYATQPSNDDTKEIDFRRYHAPYADVEAQAGATQAFSTDRNGFFDLAQCCQGHGEMVPVVQPLRIVGDGGAQQRQVARVFPV